MVGTELLIFLVLACGTLLCWHFGSAPKVGIWLAALFITYLVFQLGLHVFTHDGSTLGKAFRLIKAGFFAMIAGAITRVIVGFVWKRKVN